MLSCVIWCFHLLRDVGFSCWPERVVWHNGDAIGSLQHQSLLAPGDGWSRFTGRDTVHDDGLSLLHCHVTELVLEDRRTSTHIRNTLHRVHLERFLYSVIIILCKCLLNIASPEGKVCLHKTKAKTNTNKTHLKHITYHNAINIIRIKQIISYKIILNVFLQKNFISGLQTIFLPMKMAHRHYPANDAVTLIKHALSIKKLNKFETVALF